MNQITLSLNFFRSNFIYLLSICMPILVIEAVLTTVTLPMGNMDQIEDIQEFLSINLVIVLLLIIPAILFQIGLIGALLLGYKDRDLSVNRSVAEIYSVAFRKFIPLLASSILFGIVVFSGFFLLILPAVYLYGRLSLYSCLIVLEDEKILNSISRSWNMTDEFGGKLFVITLFFMGVSYSVPLALSSYAMDSVLMATMLVLFKYLIIIPWWHVYYTLYKSLSN